MTDFWVSDPIPQALAHYDRELRETLASIGVAARPTPWTRPVEGMTGALGKARMLVNAVLNIVSARTARHPAIQVWPSFGMLEVRLWRSRKHRHTVVLHDPRPIRPQYGHGPRATRRALGQACQPTDCTEGPRAFGVREGSGSRTFATSPY